jgi:hypothetical protein
LLPYGSHYEVGVSHCLVKPAREALTSHFPPPKDVRLGFWPPPALFPATPLGSVAWEYGYLFLVDRVEDMMVTGGENVYSTKVESALASPPAPKQLALIGIPHEQWCEPGRPPGPPLPDAAHLLPIAGVIALDRWRGVHSAPRSALQSCPEVRQRHPVVRRVAAP